MVSWQDWRAKARSTWRDHEATSSMVTSVDVVEARHSRMVLDVTARIAAAALGSGASAAETTAMALRLTDYFKITVHCDVTYSSVTMTHARTLDEDPITVLRTVRVRSSDYQRLGRIEQLVEDICDDKVQLSKAREQLDEILTSPRTYRRWVLTLATAILGAMVAIMLGGDAAEALLAGLTTGMIDRVQLEISKRRGPSFFSQASGSAVCAAVALLVMAARSWSFVDITISPSLIVAAGMVSMVAGLGLVTAARDAIDGYYVTSTARSLEVIVQTSGIVLGLLMTLWLGLRLGVPAYLAPTGGVAPVIWIQVLCAAVISICFAVVRQMGPRSWLIAAGLGAIAMACAILLSTAMGPAAAAGIGAFAVGLIAQIGTRRWQIPSVGLVTAGVVSLVPGLVIYRGIYSLVQAPEMGDSSAVQLLTRALMIAVMIAAGSSLGSLLGRPFSQPSDWLGKIAWAKSMNRGSDDESS